MSGSWITCQDPTEDCLIDNMIQYLYCIMPFMDHMSQEPTEDCLLVNMISPGMYHAIHGSHVMA